MKNPKQLSTFCAGFFSRILGVVLASTSLMFLFAGYTMAQTNSGDSPLLPWIGVWTIADDQPASASPATVSAATVNAATANPATVKPAQKSTVEIWLMSDRKGLQISRKSPGQPDVVELLIPDGTRHPINTQNCTGWRTARWIPEGGLILESSEMTCKDTGSFAASTLKMILATDQMAEILSVKAAAGHPSLAVRRLTLERDLDPAPDLPPVWVVTSARTAISAPWNLDTIIQLSKSIDTQLLEAALIERKARPSVTAQSLKQMQAAKLPKEIIDLTVALAYPDQFHIEKNGQVLLRPWLDSASSGSALSSFAPSSDLYSYYPGAFYNCYSPQGYLGYYGLGSLASGSCWSFYSPFWWDYPIFLPVTVGKPGSGAGSGVPVASPGGYAFVQPINQRHAVPRDGFYHPSPGNQGAGWQNQSGSSGGSSSGSSSGGGGGYSGSGGGGAPSSSPGGYSSGGASSSGTAVRR